MEIRKRRWGLVVGGMATVIIMLLAGATGWYYHALTAVDSRDDQPLRVEVVEGDGAQAIAGKLQQQGAIRSALAFAIHVRLEGAGGKFKVGSYTVKKNQDTPSILRHLTSGKSDERQSLQIVLFYGI